MAQELPENINNSLIEIIVETLKRGDRIALPAFGAFGTNKVDEKIVTDEATGERIMYPPSISLEFTPALKLTKTIKESHE